MARSKSVASKHPYRDTGEALVEAGLKNNSIEDMRLRSLTPVNPLHLPRAAGVPFAAMRLAQLAALVVATVACAADPVPITACTAGASVSCTCSSGATGAQVCRGDGSGYGACVCSGSDAGADAVAVGDAGPDAMQLDAAADGGGDAVAVGDAADVFVGFDVGGPCPSLLAYCNGVCRDVRNDPRNCGLCGNLCPEGWSCTNAMCVDARADAGRD